MFPGLDGRLPTVTNQPDRGEMTIDFGPVEDEQRHLSEGVPVRFVDVSEVGGGQLQSGDFVALGVTEGHQHVQLIAVDTDPPPATGDSVSVGGRSASETSTPRPAHLRSLSIRLCLSFRHPEFRERPLLSELLPDPSEQSTAMAG